MTDRNYAKDMRTVIDEAISHGGYIRRQVSSEIVEKLRANDEDLLSGWLDEQAEDFVYLAIGGISRSKRSYVSKTRGRTAFAEAAEAFEAEQRGETPEGEKRLRDFLGLPYIVGDGTERALGTLTADDLTFVADGYEKRERDNAFWKTFMRTLAKKVGADTVADHYTNDQLAAMFDSLG